jgi:hypothetical protein
MLTLVYPYQVGHGPGVDGLAEFGREGGERLGGPDLGQVARDPLAALVVHILHVVHAGQGQRLHHPTRTARARLKGAVTQYMA